MAALPPTTAFMPDVPIPAMFMLQLFRMPSGFGCDRCSDSYTCLSPADVLIPAMFTLQLSRMSSGPGHDRGVLDIPRSGPGRDKSVLDIPHRKFRDVVFNI